MWETANSEEKSLSIGRKASVCAQISEMTGEGSFILPGFLVLQFIPKQTQNTRHSCFSEVDAAAGFALILSAAVFNFSLKSF